MLTVSAIDKIDRHYMSTNHQNALQSISSKAKPLKCPASPPFKSSPVSKDDVVQPSTEPKRVLRKKSTRKGFTPPKLLFLLDVANSRTKISKNEPLEAFSMSSKTLSKSFQTS